MKELGIEKQYLAELEGGVTRNVIQLSHQWQYQIIKFRYLCQSTLKGILLRHLGKNLKILVIFEIHYNKFDKKMLARKSRNQVILHESYQVSI